MNQGLLLLCECINFHVYSHEGYKYCTLEQKILYPLPVIWIQCFNTTLHTVAGALHMHQRSADTQSRGNSVNTSSFPYIEVLQGWDGRDGQDVLPDQKGDQGVAGPPGPRNGGVVYTRWGKSSQHLRYHTGVCMDKHGINIREEQATISACLMI